MSADPVSVVLIVYFGKKEDDEKDGIGFYLCVRSDIPKTLYGQPLWMPHGKAIFRWAIDHVTCSDERWVVLGPYETRDDARGAFAVIPVAARLRGHHAELLGYRIVNEHCWDELIGSYPNEAWTDG